MIRVGLAARLRSYRYIAPALVMIAIYMFRHHPWVWMSMLALVLLGTSLERCPRCRGSLLIFGKPRKTDAGDMICRNCGIDESHVGYRPPGSR